MSTTREELATNASGYAPLVTRADQHRYWRQVLQRLKKDPVTLVSAAILGAIILMAFFAPWITPEDPNAGSALRRLKPLGTPGHFLGTDEIGRDLWTRIAYGARLSLLSGVLPVAIAFSIGGALGVVAGYVGGRLNTAIMRSMDIFYAFPSVLLAIAICSVVGAGLLNSVLALSIVFVPPIARVAESVTTRIRSLDFIEAARATGASTIKILLNHVLSNVLGVVLVYATSLVGLSIILASGLSFLGLGIPPPAAEWGQMLNALRQSIYVQPWIAALPGLMIFTTSLCFNLISDGLRGAMESRNVR